MSIYKLKQHPTHFDGLQHTCADRTPYTYLIGWSKLNKWYYGCRDKKSCHPTEFFNVKLCKTRRYNTSSRFVKAFIAEHGEPDIIEIRQIFNSTNACRLWEQRVLTKMQIPNNTKFLNKHIQNEHFKTTGAAPAKVLYTNEKLGLIPLDDSRWDTQEIVGSNYGNSGNAANTGYAAAKNIDGISVGLISIDDPRWNTGEIVGNRKGSKNSNKQRELNSVRLKGKKQSAEHAANRMASLRRNNATRKLLSI